MSNKVVVFNGARQHSFSTQKDCMVTLNAGSNVVSVEKINRLMGETDDESINAMASVPFVDMVASGDIKILDDDAVVEATESKPDDKTGIKTSSDNITIDIVKLGAKEAIEVISVEMSAEKVEGYLNAENASGDARKTVVAAAEKAIKALTAPPEED